MENFEETGLFWLPANPEDQVAGELVFDVKEGVSLSLIKSSSQAWTWPENPGLILGETGTKRVTLLDAFQKNHRRSAPNRIEYRVFHADQLLIGHAFNCQEDLKFTSATVSYCGLAEWVDRSGVTESTDFSEDGRRDSLTFRYDQPEDMNTRFSTGTVSIRFPWTLNNGVAKLTLTHFPSVHLQYDDTLEYQEILQHIAYIQSFITLCTDKAVASEKIKFYSRDIPVRMLDGSVSRWEQPIEYGASFITSPAFAAKSRPQLSLQLGYDATGGIETIAKWLQIASEYRPVVNLMTTIRSERVVYAENRFLNLANAAEAFHRLKYLEETQIPTTEYGQLLERIHSVTPDEHREWLSKKLQYLNDPTLRKRLQRLGAETKQVTGGLTGKISRWASTIADVRNELTHTSKSKIDTFPGGVLHWLGESIYAVLRICLLKECIADDDFDRLAGSQGASQLEAFVGASLTDAHEILKILKQRANSA